ncbi:hypothetical protein [Actinomyces howellii]|uniref:Uncharacterized protein n=1 Tax=Actinomyces howellii TaxID=52771 RepID=A0A448HK08_9ACTO|nr:hypothetical protein [Actinomyces howellii]VEG30041.1 Uncharacterised protein [Actinomyces howellii]
MHLGLPIPQAVDAIDRILVDFPPVPEVLAGLGGLPGQRYGEPVLVGQGWEASLRPRPFGGEEITLAPCLRPEAGRYPVEALAAGADRLGTELARRHGDPCSMEADSSGAVRRLLRAGRTGVLVSTAGGRLSVSIDALDNQL